MVCPKCSGSNVQIQVVNEVKEKRKRGAAYWLIVGWWLEPTLWIMFGVFKLLFEIFRNGKKVTSKTSSFAICQNCGNRWKVK